MLVCGIIVRYGVAFVHAAHPLFSPCCAMLRLPKILSHKSSCAMRRDAPRLGGTDFSLGHFRSVLPTFYFSVSLAGEGGS